jgi:STE24 endopeptidase
VLSGAALALVAVRPPRAVRRALERGGRRPLAASAALGAGMAVALTLVVLPLSAVAHQRARDVGLSTQGWPAWLGDVGKSTALEAALAAGGGALAVALMRRFPRGWWAPGAVAIVAVSGALVFLSPVVIDPLFNKFEPLPHGRLRSDVLELARRSEVSVGQVYRVDASRRTTGLNAYVWGLGKTKRVVLYDTLIDGLPDDQIRSVVAHELSHVKHRDVMRGLLWLAIVAPAGTYLVKALTDALRRDRRPAGPATLPTLALSAAVVALALGCAGNVLSREVESRADAYALGLTRDPAAFIELERSLTVRNVAQPDPPGAFQLLFGTHPTTLERIGIGLAWARKS